MAENEFLSGYLFMVNMKLHSCEGHRSRTQHPCDST